MTISAFTVIIPGYFLFFEFFVRNRSIQNTFQETLFYFYVCSRYSSSLSRLAFRSSVAVQFSFDCRATSIAPESGHLERNRIRR
jgi:hypothetical protein